MWLVSVTNVTGLGNSGGTEGCWGVGVTGEASLLRVQKRCLGQVGYCSGSGLHGNRCLLSFEFGVVVFLFALSWELENPGSVVLQPPVP